MEVPQPARKTTPSRSASFLPYSKNFVRWGSKVFSVLLRLSELASRNRGPESQILRNYAEPKTVTLLKSRYEVITVQVLLG